ncbi:hypothetical protein JB92DRAFT_1265093 [Gautieria morchelliformis]|nr:hypothetical protein JB92DRAFT_1265093 [Gautieria morchelliformis]
MSFSHPSLSFSSGCSLISMISSSHPIILPGLRVHAGASVGARPYESSHSSLPRVVLSPCRFILSPSPATHPLASATPIGII